jgi:hypothetical protein
MAWPIAKDNIRISLQAISETTENLRIFHVLEKIPLGHL